MPEKDYKVQTDVWASAARSVVETIPWIDFLGWHGEHYAIVNRNGGGGYAHVGLELKELPVRRKFDSGAGVDLGGEDGNWLERKDVPIDYEMTGVDVC